MVKERALVFIVVMLSMPNPSYAMKEAWGDFASPDVICLSHRNIGDLSCVEWDSYNPAKIAKLDVSHNVLTSFQLGPILQRFPALKELDLSNNQIPTITAESLNGMPDRFSLDLSHNPISSISDVSNGNVEIGNHGIVIDLRGHQLGDEAFGILRSVIVRELSLRDKAKSNASFCGRAVGGLGCFGGILILALAYAGLKDDWDPALVKNLFVGGGAGIVSAFASGIALCLYAKKKSPNRLIISDEV